MIDPAFQFTQSNLQDYLTCQRRFELRYLRRLNWPAVESDPIQEAERRMQLGIDFHRLIHQHLLGLPEAALTASAQATAAATQSPELAEMWANYLAQRLAELSQPGVRLYPEVSLTAMVEGYRLAVRYDLLAFLPGEPASVVIVDWKTSSHRTKAETLRNRVQSRIYPLVLSLAGAGLNDQRPIDPAQVTMIYWFAAHPSQPEKIVYSQDRFEADRTYLLNLLRQAAGAVEFPLTSDESHCRFCVYRSFCDRGQVAGPLDDTDDDLTFDALTLDWEQITEIAY